MRVLARIGLTLAGLAPLGWVSAAGIMLVMLVGAIGLFYGACLRRNGQAAAGTWDCGYAAPAPRMQYTSSSFAQMLVHLFGWALRPKVRAHRPAGLFPGPAHFHSDVADTTLDEAVLPGVRFLARFACYFRVFQQGKIQAYVLYIFLILLTLFLFR